MLRFVFGLVLVTTLSACGREAQSVEDRDSEELSAMEMMESAPGHEAPHAIPEAPARVVASRPPPPVSSPPVPAILAGTVMVFEVREHVSTASHVAGESFSLMLVEGVTGQAGATLAPGTMARGLVTTVERSTGPQDEAILGVRVASVAVAGSQRALEGIVESVSVSTSGRDSDTRTAATIVTGAAAGAILGQILGHNTRSTVVGAAVGTAVGVAVALKTRGGDAHLTQGSRLVVRLERDLVF
jgi:hypothetical protein